MSLQVIFGTGPVGCYAALRLLEKGHTVRMVNRSGKVPDLPEPPAAEALARLETRAADATDPRAALAAAEGATHIYHCANVLYQDWQRVLPPMNAAIVEAAHRNGAVLAYAENLYMYARGTPVINEGTPTDPPSRKGKLRQELFEHLVEAGTQYNFPWVTVRASDFYGPGAGLQSVFGTSLFLDPLYAGKQPRLLGNPAMPHTYTYVGDYGRALADAALDPAAHRHAWIVPNDRTLTTREVAALFFAAAGRGKKVSTYPRALLATVALFSPLIREVLEVLHQKEEPYVVDGSAFQARFGFAPTRLEEGIRRTIAWYEARRR